MILQPTSAAVEDHAAEAATTTGVFDANPSISLPFTFVPCLIQPIASSLLSWAAFLFSWKCLLLLSSLMLKSLLP